MAGGGDAGAGDIVASGNVGDDDNVVAVLDGDDAVEGPVDCVAEEGKGMLELEVPRKEPYG
jgi:hypothetical protein